MKKLFITLYLLLIPGIIMAMGTFGKSSAEIPKPEQNFHATIVDQLDISTDVENMSCEGNTFLEGQRGLASVTTQFDKIKNIKFNIENEDKIFATVNLLNDNQFEIQVSKNLKCYGMSVFGTYTIKAKNIKEIVFKR